MASRADEMVGRGFGLLTVIERAGTDSARRAVWACRCACGRNTTVRGDHLRRGGIKSCGQCGAFHPQGLTADTAVYLLRAYTADRHDSRINAFGAAFYRESGALVYKPRKPTYIHDPIASAMQQLALAGHVRAKENRSTITRWATEEKCVIEITHAYESEHALHAAWEMLTGEPVEEVTQKAENVPVYIEPPPLSPDSRQALDALYAKWSE